MGSERTGGLSFISILNRNDRLAAPGVSTRDRVWALASRRVPRLSRVRFVSSEVKRSKEDAMITAMPLLLLMPGGFAFANHYICPSLTNVSIAQRDLLKFFCYSSPSPNRSKLYKRYR